MYREFPNQILRVVFECFLLLMIEIVTLGPLAQLVEQRTFNPWVVGSIPTGPTYFYEFNLLFCGLCVVLRTYDDNHFPT